ncbi:MAG: hypothetical protein H6736_12665 [Alphaproteobacteria bacterium]|nr:hypothetical protein [Alphaproteobacteria bacterium]MCB9692655.1 hypothetical protein [Alphaproteobacteria bacterium]
MKHNVLHAALLALLASCGHPGAPDAPADADWYLDTAVQRASWGPADSEAAVTVSCTSPGEITIYVAAAPPTQLETPDGRRVWATGDAFESVLRVPADSPFALSLGRADTVQVRQVGRDGATLPLGPEVEHILNRCNLEDLR